MHAPYELPSISVSDATLGAADVDLLFIPIAQDHLTAAAQRYDAPLGADLRAALERGEFRAKPYEIYAASATVPGWRASRVMFVGGGARAEIDVERFRRMAAAAANAARTHKRTRIGWADLDRGAIGTAARIETIAEGFVLANFDNGVHKSRHDQQCFVREAVIFSSDGGAGAAATSGRAMGESINGARVLINEPGNYLTPRVMAEKTAELASMPGLSAEILDEKTIQSLNMGLLLGVARGSVEPPRILVLKYSPAGAPAGKTLGLVGKGITFDTGGLSLKP